MRFRFSYVVIKPYKRPIIPITLRHEGNSIKYLALIDSGADFNIFDSEIADILKIDLSKLKEVKFSGINKDAEATGRYTGVTLGIEKFMFESPVIFSDQIPSFGCGILGQQGFFNHFRIKFDYKKSDIQLRTGND